MPAPPWHYSGDLLTVEYRTDPARVAELLPAPLELAADDPGAVALIWADWQSCGVDGEELLDPVASQYKECFVVVRCAYGGQMYSRCVFIWVDKDFALARGIHQGYPKKLGSHPPDPAAPVRPGGARIAPGGSFAGTLAAGDRRLAEAVVTLREPAETNGFVNAHPMAHHRVHAGDRARAGRDAFAELIESGRARSRPARPGAATPSSSCSTRPPRSWPGSRSRDHRRLLPAGRRRLGRRLALATGLAGPGLVRPGRAEPARLRSFGSERQDPGVEGRRRNPGST